MGDPWKWWVALLLVGALVLTGAACAADPGKVPAEDLFLDLEDVPSPDTLPPNARDALNRLYGIAADGTISPGEEAEVRSSVAELCAGLNARDGSCGLDVEDYLLPEGD